MTHRFLIIDDDEEAWKTVEETSAEMNVALEYASDGDAALTLMANRPYDLLFLSLELSGGKGLMVLRHIREAGHHTATVLMSTGITVADTVEAMRLGVIDLIERPGSTTVVQETLRRMKSKLIADAGTLADYAEHLAHAKHCIREKRLDEAAEALKHCLALNEDAAEPHNLIGVIAELRGDLSAAGKHYRAACALDPTYRPADANLRRMTDFNYSLRGIALDDSREPR